MTEPEPERATLRPQVPVWFLIAVMSLMTVTAMGFLWLGKRLAPGANLPETELRILSRAFAAIDKNYIFELDEERRTGLLHAAISGMVDDLDRYSHYYRPEDEESYNRDTNGFLTGIGVVVQTVDKRIRLLYPMPDGPAEAAGLQVGDVIVAIDGKPVEETSAAIKLIKGPNDSFVRLTIHRGDAAPKVIAIKRQLVRIPSVKWVRVLDAGAGLGYVFLQKFTRSSVEEFDAAITQLRADLGDTPLRGLVIDLRRNPGGLLSTCLELTNRFLSEGKLLTIQPRNQDEEVHFAKPDACKYPDLQLVLLIDQESASASEVMAGALQDHQRARLVGVRSWGKGVVNEVYRWSDQKVRLKLTTSYYLTPKGRRIERRLLKTPSEDAGGIVPDAQVSFDKKKHRLDVLRRLHRREVPRLYREAFATLRQEFPSITMVRPLPPDQDLQLAHGLSDLRELLHAAEHK